MPSVWLADIARALLLGLCGRHHAERVDPGALLGPNRPCFTNNGRRQSSLVSLRHGLQHGTVLLVAVHQPAGMAVAFPCVGLAMLIGGGVSCFINLPCPRPWRWFELIQHRCWMPIGARSRVRRPRPTRDRLGERFFTAPFTVSSTSHGRHECLDPYAAVVTGVGILGCTIITNYGSCRPIAGGEPVTFMRYIAAPIRFHVFGILGGVFGRGQWRRCCWRTPVWHVSHALAAEQPSSRPLGNLSVESFARHPSFLLVFVGMLMWFLIGVTVIAWANQPCCLTSDARSNRRSLNEPSANLGRLPGDCLPTGWFARQKRLAREDNIMWISPSGLSFETPRPTTIRGFNFSRRSSMARRRPRSLMHLAIYRRRPMSQLLITPTPMTQAPLPGRPQPMFADYYVYVGKNVPHRLTSP